MLMEHTFEYIIRNRLDLYTIANIFTAHTYNDNRDNLHTDPIPIPDHTVIHNPTN